jgi:hypothetical protein
MKLSNKKIFTLFLGLFSFFAFSAKAVCPVCVVAIGSGVGLCRWLGIDDTISGLWIGGLVVSIILWTLDWMNKKNFRFKFRNILIWALYYVLIIWPLFSFNIMGHPLNKVWGMDKLLVGIIAGSIIFLFSVFLNGSLKKKNGGKVYFYYQKVIIPVVLLLIFSFIFYFVIKCN